MNNQVRRRILVSQSHCLYESNRHLRNNDHTAFGDVEHYYDVNTPIATVRCFWQHIVSSIRGANLVNIRVYYMEGLDNFFDEKVMDRHRDGTLVTIRYLAGLNMYNINNNPIDDCTLNLIFQYVVGNVVDQPPHCICIL